MEVMYECMYECMSYFIGEAQPADISIQRVLKVKFRKEFQAWLTENIMIQILKGWCIFSMYV